MRLLLHVSAYDHHQGACMNLAKVIITLKHSVKLCRYLLCDGVAVCLGVACVLCRVRGSLKVVSRSRRRMANHFSESL